MEKVKAYNEGCKEKLCANGYGPVLRDNKEYWPGVVDIEHHDQFRTVGAKRYAFTDNGEVYITVAGVPKKKGRLCLNNDIENFKEGFIFDSATTGKQTHTYFFTEDIHIDQE